MWGMWTLLLLIAILAVFLAPRFVRPRPGGGAMEGTLLITGVSPRPEDATGEQYVTIAGVINGPTVNEHEVYQRLAVDVDNWPTMGELRQVMYAPRNPDRWSFGAPDGPAQ